MDSFGFRVPWIGLDARVSQNGVFIHYYLLFSQPLGLNVILPRGHNKFEFATELLKFLMVRVVSGA